MFSPDKVTIDVKHLELMKTHNLENYEMNEKQESKMMKRKMIKKVFVGIMTASMLVLTAGCDKSSSKDSAEVIAESVVESVVENVAESVEESVVEKIDAEIDAEIDSENQADDDNEDDAEGAEVDAADIDEADPTDEVGGNEDAKASIVGVYVKEFTEELDGQEISGEYTYTFNEDHTGVADIQDTVEFTWNDSKIIEGAYEYDFTVEDGVLKIDRDGFVDEYVKKN